MHRASWTMAERIDITPMGEHCYRVTVGGTGVTTVHDVVVPPTLIADLGVEPGTEAEERVVRISFSFLLERERPESILPRFDLDVIGRYFPEYLATICSQVGPSAS